MPLGTPSSVGEIYARFTTYLSTNPFEDLTKTVHPIATGCDTESEPSPTFAYVGLSTQWELELEVASWRGSRVPNFPRLAPS